MVLEVVFIDRLEAYPTGRETVPVTDETEIPGLIQIAIGAIEADESILGVIAAAGDAEAIAAHRAGDGLGGLVLVQSFRDLAQE